MPAGPHANGGVRAHPGQITASSFPAQPRRTRPAEQSGTRQYQRPNPPAAQQTAREAGGVRRHGKQCPQQQPFSRKNQNRAERAKPPEPAATSSYQKTSVCARRRQQQQPATRYGEKRKKRRLTRAALKRRRMLRRLMAFAMLLASSPPVFT